ncbi:hypothetical protein K440DRAFT_658768 [Wilcoxina mikolae CBS 423.85]|nr:hypothetical protein K440DRAFT_658768 [Wilcoxina mikolae CBS 423.85]
MTRGLRPLVLLHLVPWVPSMVVILWPLPKQYCNYVPPGWRYAIYTIESCYVGKITIDSYFQVHIPTMILSRTLAVFILHKKIFGSRKTSELAAAIKKIVNTLAETLQAVEEGVGSGVASAIEHFPKTASAFKVLFKLLSHFPDLKAPFDEASTAASQPPAPSVDFVSDPGLHPSSDHVSSAFSFAFSSFSATSPGLSCTVTTITHRKLQSRTGCLPSPASSTISAVRARLQPAIALPSLPPPSSTTPIQASLIPRSPQNIAASPPVSKKTATFWERRNFYRNNSRRNRIGMVGRIRRWLHKRKGMEVALGGCGEEDAAAGEWVREDMSCVYSQGGRWGHGEGCRFPQEGGGN